MNFCRIWALFLRYSYIFLKLDHLSELLYWPALDIFLWGMTSMWIQNNQETIPDLTLAILTGLVFWQITTRVNYEISANILQEFWSRNFVNLFATPITVGEWIASMMLVGLAKMGISLCFGSLIVYLLYTLNVFSMGWLFIPFAISLSISGWFIGLISGSIIIYYGQRVQALYWLMAYAFAPFSAVFCPVDALPTWVQPISRCLPMTYIFEGMRKIIQEKVFSLHDLLMSFALNAIYMSLSVLLFHYLFKKSRNKGLSRLE